MRRTLLALALALSACGPAPKPDPCTTIGGGVSPDCYTEEQQRQLRERTVIVIR